MLAHGETSVFPPEGLEEPCTALKRAVGRDEDVVLMGELAQFWQDA